MNVTYVGALIAGLLSFLSPCVLPLVPPYLCFLGGTTFDQLTGEDETPSHVYTTVVLSSVAFVLGFTTVFVILGATATVAGQLLVANLPLLSKIAGVIIIIAGLHFLGRDPLAHAASRGALSRRRAAGRPDRRLCHRPCLRLRLDALHRAGARGDPGRRRGRGLGAPRRQPAPGLFARARHPVRAGCARHQAVHARHAAVSRPIWRRSRRCWAASWC